VIESPIEDFGRFVFVDEFVGTGRRPTVGVDDEELLLDTERPARSNASREPKSIVGPFSVRR